MNFMRLVIFMYLANIISQVMLFVFYAPLLTEASINDSILNNSNIPAWLRDMGNRVNSSQQIDPTRIFGDFVLALRLMTDLFTGESISSLLSNLSPTISLIVQIIYVLTSLIALASFIANRIV